MAENDVTTRNPLVSVIVPVYNVEPYVADAVRSVIGQTMDSWELICVDDGSHDNSLDICRELAAADGRISVVAQEHAGPGAARNRALSLARGRYVYFLDGDDMLLPDALERCVRAAEEADADMVQFDGSILVQDGAWHDEHMYKRSRAYPGVWNGAELYLAQCEAGDYKAASYLSLSRRELIADCGGGLSGDVGIFPPGVIHEDESATYRLIVGASRVVCLPDALYIRRYRPNSIMTALDWRASTRGYFRAYALAYSDTSGRGPAQGAHARAERRHLDLMASFCFMSFYHTGAPVGEFASVCDARAGDEAALESLLARKELDPCFFRFIRRAKLVRWRLGPIKRRLMAMLHPGAGHRGKSADHREDASS